MATTIKACVHTNTNTPGTRSVSSLALGAEGRAHECSSAAAGMVCLRQRRAGFDISTVPTSSLVRGAMRPYWGASMPPTPGSSLPTRCACVSDPRGEPVCLCACVSLPTRCACVREFVSVPVSVFCASVSWGGGQHGCGF
jgi:hypothetical protein